MVAHRLSARFWRGALAAALIALAAPAAPSRAAQVVAPASARLDIEVSKGRLVKLERPAASVFVADPEVADIQVKSPTLVYVIGKAAGETTLFAVGDNDEILLNTGITVRHNLQRLQQALHELVPDSPIDVSSVDDSLVLSGTVYSAAEGEDIRRIAARFVPAAAQLVNKLQVDQPNQVNIRVRVAEMSREVIKAFGFNWEGAAAPGSFLFGLATGNPVFTGPVTLLSKTARQFNTRTPTVGTNNSDSLFGSVQTNRFDVNSVIDALDKEGLVQVLAEPNLTALSGEQASFLAGGEFPIPVPQGNGTISIDFKRFGVSLSFVATIGPRGRISLHVKPEVSQLSTDGAITLQNVVIPALTTRRAETTVELGSGQSFAIAGLLQNNLTQDLHKYPWLGDIPVLGTLFRSDRFHRNETELVIIVTPYVVRPVSSKQLASPTDGYVAPNDAERVLGGATFRPQLVNGAKPPASRDGTILLGPYGFDLQ